MDSGLAASRRPGMTETKSQGAADRHIGCAQHDRPSTGGGGKDGRPPYQSATAMFVPLWPWCRWRARRRVHEILL